jgi:hypothetical protein
MSNTTCFEAIDSTNLQKTSLVVISVISSLIIIPAAFSLIWYEKFGSDKRRTLINKLVSALCWNGMVFLSTCQLAYAVRFYFGPLPKLVCFWLFVIRKAIVINLVLLATAMTLTRYIFIFWLKNPAAFNDEFWFVFVNLWIAGLSFITQFLRGSIPGSQLLEYSICSGEDPSTILSSPPFMRGIFELLSLIIHIYAHLRIIIHKRKEAATIGPSIFAKFFKNMILQDLEKQSLTCFAINFACSLLLALGTVSIVLIKIRSCMDLKDNLNSILIVYSYLIHPNLSAVCLIAMYLLRNKLIFPFILREIKDLTN